MANLHSFLYDVILAQYNTFPMVVYSLVYFNSMSPTSIRYRFIARFFDFIQ